MEWSDLKISKGQRDRNEEPEYALYIKRIKALEQGIFLTSNDWGRRKGWIHKAYRKKTLQERKYIPGLNYAP